VRFELAVGTEHALRCGLRLRGRVHECLHALFDLPQGLSPPFELLEAPGHLVESGHGRFGLQVHLFERLADLRQLRAAHRDLGQHGAERAAFFLGGDDQALEVLGLLLGLAAAETFECVEHMEILSDAAVLYAELLG
jgi:hypothetical protein